MSTRAGILIIAGLLIAGVAVADSKEATFAVAVGGEERPARSVLDFTVKNIDGKRIDLRREFEGDVLLIVNVASKCGFTPQYAGLEAMYRRYKERGFTVLGFPANEFGQQEPGTDEEIKLFCTETYDVTFPMFSKIVVKGKKIHPLYRFLTEEQPDERFRGEIEWNFTKFLVGRDGRVIARFKSKVAPEDPALVGAVEAALDVPRPAKQEKTNATR